MLLMWVFEYKRRYVTFTYRSPMHSVYGRLFATSHSARPVATPNPRLNPSNPLPQPPSCQPHQQHSPQHSSLHKKCKFSDPFLLPNPLTHFPARYPQPPAPTPPTSPTHSSVLLTSQIVWIFWPLKHDPEHFCLQTIPGAPWSYPENLETIVIPVHEFLADKQTIRRIMRFIYRWIHYIILTIACNVKSCI